MSVLRRKFDLPQPTELTRRRFLEVEFYLSFRHLIDLTYGEKALVGAELIRCIAKICDVQEFTLMLPYKEITTYGATPTKNEIAITLYYYGMSYRDIYNIYGIHADTVRKYIMQYLDEGCPSLKPRLPPNMYEDLIKALRVIDRVIVPLWSDSEVLTKGNRFRKTLEGDKDV